MSKYDKVIEAGQGWFMELTMKMSNEDAKMFVVNPLAVLRSATFKHRYEWIALITVLRLSTIVLGESFENGVIAVYWSPEYLNKETFINCYEDTKKRLRSNKTSAISIGILDGRVYYFNLFTGKMCYKQPKKLAYHIFENKALQ